MDGFFVEDGCAGMPLTDRQISDNRSSDGPQTPASFSGSLHGAPVLDVVCTVGVLVGSEQFFAMEPQHQFNERTPNRFQ